MTVVEIGRLPRPARARVLAEDEVGDAEANAVAGGEGMRGAALEGDAVHVDERIGRARRDQGASTALGHDDGMDERQVVTRDAPRRLGGAADGEDPRSDGAGLITELEDGHESQLGRGRFNLLYPRLDRRAHRHRLGHSRMVTTSEGDLGHQQRHPGATAPRSTGAGDGGGRSVPSLGSFLAA